MKRILSLLMLIIVLGSYPVEASGKVVTERLSGSNRIETSIAISNKVYKESETVILSSTTGEVDALAGTILASYKKAPILLIYKDKLPETVKQQIKKLNAKTIYLLGGEGIISKSIEEELSNGYNVIRIAGSNRVETAIKISNEIPNKSNEMFLTDGFGSLADALSIGPISASHKTPILLTNKDSLSKETLDEILKHKPNKITVIGGVVTQKVINQIPKGIVVDVIAGKDRAETAIKIAQIYNNGTSKAILANGYTLADALVGGYMAAETNRPILLTSSNKATNETKKYMNENINDLIILGGESVVSENTLNPVPIPIPPINKITTLSKLRIQALNQMKTLPSSIELEYYGNDINSYADVVKFAYSIIDTGNYATGNIDLFYSYYLKENGKVIIKFNFEYRTTDIQEQFINKEIDRIIKLNIKSNMNDYTKVKVIHDYLVNNMTYESNTINSQYSAYTLLKEGKGVCNAYALTFDKFMDKLNIESIYIKGDAKSRDSKTWGLHAWNKVKVDNKWYNIDTTWDFPASKWGLHNAYYNFMNSDVRFYKTHTPTNSKDLPKSIDTKYDGVYDNNYNKK